MSVRRNRSTVLGTITTLLLAGLILAGAVVGGYLYLEKGSVGAHVDELRAAQDYAREYIDVFVKEVRDPGGMWFTIPVVLAVSNAGMGDVYSLRVSVTFFDEDGEVVWKDKVTDDLSLASGHERVVVWKFTIGRLIGSNVKKASRVRFAEVEPLCAWTRDSEDPADMDPS